MYTGARVKYQSRCVHVKGWSIWRWLKGNVITLHCERGPVTTMVYAKDIECFPRWMSRHDLVDVGVSKKAPRRRKGMERVFMLRLENGQKVRGKTGGCQREGHNHHAERFGKNLINHVVDNPRLRPVLDHVGHCFAPLRSPGGDRIFVVVKDRDE